MEEALAYLFQPYLVYAYTAIALICQFAIWLVRTMEVPQE